MGCVPILSCQLRLLPVIATPERNDPYQQRNLLYIAAASGCDSVTQPTLATITKIIQTVNADVSGAYHFNGRSSRPAGVYRDSIRLAGGCGTAPLF